MLMKTATLLLLASSAFAAPFSGKAANDAPDLVSRQFVDPGPTPPANCTLNPLECPPSPGPSGTLNYPNDGNTLYSTWDNAGYVDVSYTPVNSDAGNGHVSTSSVIFTLREYFPGADSWDDKVRVLASLGIPDDFSTINVRLSLPGRTYDGDSSASNDLELGGGCCNTSVGQFGFEVIEQQAWKADRGSSDAPTLIEFMSARPLVTIDYVAPHD
ncbi:hypothetical protein T439DRAFT_73048 [Meredithblackwellia eburnea MCA 4105]